MEWRDESDLREIEGDSSAKRKGRRGEEKERCKEDDCVCDWHKIRGN